jgi:3-oxoacyl-[acyl-carrier protein] reductase
MNYTDKICIVTGAAQGMGASVARMLSQQGVKVAVADINVTKAEQIANEMRTSGGRAIAVEVDVSSSASCNLCAEATLREFGAVDFLVNNAGLVNASHMPRLHAIDEADYYRVLAVNMHSCLFMSRAVLNAMKARGGGAIVNVSSIAAWQAGGVYGLSKLGVNGITFSLARELGPFNIRVNAIAPGPVDTEGMKEVMTVEQMSEWGKSVGRATAGVAVPDNIAAVTLFLLSDAAHYINGQIIPIDGGIVIRP